MLTLRRILFNLYLPPLLHRLPYDLVVGFDIDGFRYAAQAGNTRYICSIKGVLAEELQHERGTVRLLLWSLSRLEHINARRADLVLTTSAYCRHKIHQHYAVPLQRIRIVPEGIDLPGWQQALARLAVPRDPFAILCVARQYPRKCIADLLHAFVRVQQEEPHARLTIVGDGPQHASLRHLAHTLGLDAVVQFTGALPDNQDVLAWYKRSAIFCLPSIQEGFGIVFLEAMASGLPIVSTTAAAIPEVVPHRHVGLLVPPRDPAALAAALLTLLHQPALCRAYADAGQAHVQQFAWEQVAERFLSACRAVTIP